MKSRFLIIALILLAFVSCNKEDDLDEIFTGRFKVTGYRYNGTCDNTNLKEMNKSMDIYWISFSGETFSGMLVDGVTFNGTWKADSETREMSMKISNEVMHPTELCRFVTNIIKNATRYSGDHNVLTIYQDSNNYIDLNSGLQ